jgi:hypothetical protein
MAKIKVRFNLSRGKNYMKWKIAHPDGEIEYLDPDGFNLLMKKCNLRNSTKTAQKIFDGENKSVCAWILCDSVIISERQKEPLDEDSRLRYNPKINPNWDFRGINVDGKQFGVIESRGSKLYIIY